MPVTQWRPHEVVLRARRAYGNPYLDVDVWAEVTGPDGRTRRVYGFWDGDDAWRVRIAPMAPGAWRWVTGASAADDGLAGQAGAIECAPPTPEQVAADPLARGFLRVSPNRRYLMHADGTPFFWLGDTCWMAAARVGFADGAFERYFLDRRAKGFNVVLMYVGFPAWSPAHTGLGGWDPNDHVPNEGGPVFLERYTRINPAYFQWLDRRIAWLNAHGFVPYLLPARRDNINTSDGMGLAGYWPYLRYAAARYGAYALVWGLQGELDYQHASSMEEANRLGHDLAFERNPHGHPITFHPLRFTGDRFNRANWLDVHLVQSGHTRASIHGRAIDDPFKAWHLRPTRPVVYEEPWYEGMGDSRLRLAGLPDARATTDHIRQQGYAGVLQGARGYTYGAHGLWNWTTDDGRFVHARLFAESEPWWTAMAYPGSGQMIHLKAFFTGIAWWELEPARDLISPFDYEPANPDRTWAFAAATPARRVVAAYLEAECPPVTLHDLRPAPYRARWFDPRTGAWQAIDGGARPSADGAWPAPPAPDRQDWALLLKTDSG
jgi:Protein of unknown function (DUF4038)/Domain of unknown function (DUF5060)